MADFKMTFHSDETFKMKFNEPEEDFVIKFEEIIERVPSNYGLITRIGNAIRIS